MEFPKMVMPHSDSKCTTARSLSPGYLQLDKSLHENCFEIPSQSTASQSDGFNISDDTNFLNSDWYGQNPETNCFGGAWETDDIEEQLEKFASQEMNDVAANPLQNSKEFDVAESAAFKVTGQTSDDSAYDVFNASSVDVNSFESIRQDPSRCVTDCCNGNSVSGRMAVQSQTSSEPCQVQSVENYCGQPSDCLTRNICLQSGTEENVERLQNTATGSENVNTNSISILPTKNCSNVEVDHCYSMSDNVRQHLKGSVDPILEQGVADGDDLPVFCFADEADLMLKNGHDSQDELFPPLVVASDAAFTEQCYIENSVDFDPCDANVIISDLSQEEPVLFEQYHSSATAADIIALLPDFNCLPDSTLVSTPDFNDLLDSTLTRNSSVSEDSIPAHQNDVAMDLHNSGSSSVQAEGSENPSQNSTIADPHFVRPSMLLQSANSAAKECLPIIYCPEDVTEQLSRENFRENETLKIDGVDDRPTEDDTPDLRIDDVAVNIKKEKPFLFDDKTNAEDGAWKDRDPYGLKECYCPHGYVSSFAGHFHCQECGSSTRHKHSTMRHEVLKHRIRHPNIKVFSCSHCSACFSHPSRFKLHVLKHGDLAQFDSKDDNATILPPDFFEHQEPNSRLLSSTAANGGCDETTSRSLTPEIENVLEAFNSSKPLKRKSDERSSGFKKIKPAVTSEEVKLDSGSTSSLPKEYTLITVTAKNTSTTCRPAYDGPLLPDLLTPTKTCKFCGQCFSRECIQARHYAQVHRFCIGGITVYQCIPCKHRTIYHCDFKKHIETERHRSTVKNKSEPNVSSGEAALIDDAQSVRYNIGKKKYGRSNFTHFKKIKAKKHLPKPSQSCGAPRRSNDRKVSIDSLLVVKNNTLHSVDFDLNAGISKYSSNRKISQFFSLMKRNKETTEGESADSLSSKIVELNACVSGHSCTLRCIRSSNMQGNVSSKVKVQCHNQSKVSSDLVKSNETEQRSMQTSFGSKVVQQQQQQDDRPSSRSVSTKPRPIAFYQDTTKTFQSPSLAQCLNPTSTKEDTIPLKSKTPVALKRTSCHRKPSLAARKDLCSQALDDGSESSNVSAVKTGTLGTVGLLKAGAKQIMSHSSHNLLNPSPGNQMVSGKTCGLDDVILLDDDDDDDDDNFVAKDQSRSTVHVSSKSDDVDGMCFNKGASLSGFSGEELFSELMKRNSLMLCCCGVYFRDSNVYSLHCAWHSEEGSLKCNFCGLSSKNWYEFYSHILNHSK